MPQKIYQPKLSLLEKIKNWLNKNKDDEANTSSQSTLDAHVSNMIKNLRKVPKIRVKEVMVSKSQMVCIDHDASLNDIIQIVNHALHSRYPVINESKDEVLGILLAKDLIRYSFDNEIKNNEEFHLKDILRPVTVIPESKRLDILLQEFRTNKNHIAIVVNEFGTITGMITIEDVLEQIVGDIEDEYDIQKDQMISIVGENTFAVQGLAPMEVFNQYFDLDWHNPSVDTIGGYITQKFAHVPKRGEKIKIEEWQFKVLKSDHRKIILLQVKQIL